MTAVPRKAKVKSGDQGRVDSDKLEEKLGKSKPVMIGPFIKTASKLDRMVYTYNPNTLEGKARKITSWRPAWAIQQEPDSNKQNPLTLGMVTYILALRRLTQEDCHKFQAILD